MTIPETLRAEIDAAAAEAVHDAWMGAKLFQGITSRKSETGEELMVPYSDLSDAAKALDAASVQATLDATLPILEAHYEAKMEALSTEIDATRAMLRMECADVRKAEAHAEQVEGENKRLRGQMDDVRVMRDKLWAERVAAVAMLRMECAEYDDNDWPDTLHLADVIEKHLADPAAEAVKEVKACAKRLREALEFYALEGRYSYDEDGVPEPENPQFSSYEDAGIRRDRGQVARRALASLVRPESMTGDS